MIVDLRWTSVIKTDGPETFRVSYSMALDGLRTSGDHVPRAGDMQTAELPAS